MDEQLLAADMHAGEDRDRAAGVDSREQLGAVMSTEIGVVLRQRLIELVARVPFDMADVAEPFGAQQRLGDVLRRPADAGRLQQSHGRGFGGWFGRERLAPDAEPAKAGRAGERGIGQKLAASLFRHGTPP